ncbi:bifunctional acetate--CoA ligase family protein/GNAT family N-acetyltransferase (plasmid) [Rhizobium sp. CB3090]|uniref:bifunctional acetate--CoA ligase family protein/GNAT family N-acetyltransferase n=1 Tax=Rhizobium sp. CB3090 TaxID=3039156 RepID=UPI0024B1F273|nr:bifunctional acetate--CoA ligase family protein/GNAT family N-acetyltransferase [Rhizobium sp. CB3090]WFU13252.1 bifunctional acetate--CoA ligase family protein/GNAT family N-acetyltransferase [Rhizobium sp. CB3090]
MSIKNLAPLFRPRSVAVIGASNRAGAIGTKILQNVIDGGFIGEVWPVNPKHQQILQRKCYVRVSELPDTPDIAVVATPAPTVPSILRELGEKGTKIAVVASAGLTTENGLKEAALAASKPYGLRIFGPNVVGLILPGSKLNASFVLTGASPGKIGLLSQSGAIVSSLLDWASERGIGFSQVLSLGDMIDVDIGDGIDLLAGDHETSAIIIYLESIVNPRKFVSAARAAGRLKPLIAIVPGRHKAAAKAAATHTGALTGEPRVIDAILKRAGIVRVTALSELFAAAEITAKVPPLTSARVGIVTNGGGAGVLAVDGLLDHGEALAPLADRTMASLDDLFPNGWSKSNPVDVLGDASPDRIAAAIHAVALDPAVDVVLALYCPVQAAPPAEVASAIISTVQAPDWPHKRLLSCLLGGSASREGRQILCNAGIPDYGLPEDAITALHVLGQWGRRQEQLTHVATTTPLRFDRDGAMRVFEEVAKQSRTMLTEVEAKAVLGFYEIPVAECVVAKNVAAVEQVAAELLHRYPSIVVKLLSRSITHKSDIGGVMLDITTRAGARRAARSIAASAAAAGLADQVEGFVLQPMIKIDNGLELFAGLSVDKVFGPTIAFGAGGIGVEQVDDIAVGLPPLDDGSATDLINATRIERLLHGFRHIRPANLNIVKSVLLALSQMAVDFPFVRAFDINPLSVGHQTAIAIDARIEIDPSRLHDAVPNRSLVIRPYPSEWTRQISVGGQDFVFRPIRPMDAKAYAAMLELTAGDDLRMRFFGQAKLSQAAIVRMTHIDYEREMALIAIDRGGGIVGVARLATDVSREWGDFGLLVRSDCQHIGLGTALLRQLLEFAGAEGLQEVRGLVLAHNHKMLALCRKAGFEIMTSPHDATFLQVRLRLSGYCRSTDKAVLRTSEAIDAASATS